MGSNVHGFSDLQSARVDSSFFGDRRGLSSQNPGERSSQEIVVFLISLFMGSSALQPSGSVLSTLGSSYGPYIQKGEVWRLLTPIFLHASIWHILFNIFFQLRMAFPLEKAYGIVTIAAIYFATGVAGNLFSVAVAPCKSAVGASTAGFGLIGIQMAELGLAWHMLRNRDQATFNIVVFVVISVMLSANPGSNIDWRGHFGGFIAGFCSSILLNRHMENQPRWLKHIGVSAAIICLVAIFTVSLIVIFAIPMSGESGRCS